MRVRALPPHASHWQTSAAPVVRAAAKAWALSYEALMGPSKAEPLPEARFAAMLVLRRQGWTYPKIAMALGRFDHTTAIHGVERAKDIEVRDPGFAVAVAAIAGEPQ